MGEDASGCPRRQHVRPCAGPLGSTSAGRLGRPLPAGPARGGRRSADSAGGRPWGDASRNRVPLSRSRPPWRPPCGSGLAGAGLAGRSLPPAQGLTGAPDEGTCSPRAPTGHTPGWARGRPAAPAEPAALRAAPRPRCAGGPTTGGPGTTSSGLPSPPSPPPALGFPLPPSLSSGSSGSI